MNVLIVEPSRIFQHTLETIFKEYAISIFICSTGEEAKNLCQEVTIDLICLSYYLADIDGLELVTQIRALKFGKTIPILLTTSKDNQAETAKSLHVGVTEIFRKTHLEDLERYLKTYAEHNRQQAHIEGTILLINPDKQESQEIIDYFQDTRLKFIHFTNAENAAVLARAAEFDLVITSVVLGGAMTGLALIREIREINETMYRVPILAISAITDASQKIELLRAGASDYIQKPVLLKELHVRMNNLLHNKKLFDTVELQKKQMEQLATHDQLTGLFNRHHLKGIADKTILEANRYNYPFSLLLIDLDFFKQVNDTYGHSIGDQVLQGLAKLLQTTFRGSDTPIRLGGEEFIVLLPHCNAHNAIARALSLRVAISELCPAGVDISASIGVSEIPAGSHSTYEQLFSAADEAVYAAKSSGRNCVVFRGVGGDISLQAEA